MSLELCKGKRSWSLAICCFRIFHTERCELWTTWREAVRWRRHEPVTAWIPVRCINCYCEPEIMVSVEQEVGWIKWATLPASSVTLLLGMTWGIDPLCAHVTNPSWDGRWTRICKFNISVQFSGQYKRESLRASLFAEQGNAIEPTPSETLRCLLSTITTRRNQEFLCDTRLALTLQSTVCKRCRKQWIWNHDRLTAGLLAHLAVCLCIPLIFEAYEITLLTESPP
jgi:hypothetical protein